MSKSSINIQPVKKTSERHNRREMDLDYVRKDLSHLNQAKEFDTINNRLKKIRAKYEETVGQKMQKRATPIREAVFLIKRETTLDDCLLLSQEIEKKWGINSFQIHMHKDEGHYNDENEWKPNLHAHLVMDWTDPETGKSRKLNKQDMSEMQTIAANILGMERGKKSDRKHLSALAYKIKIQKEKQQKLEAELSVFRALQEKARTEMSNLLVSLQNNLQKVQKMKGENEKKLRFIIRAQADETLVRLEELFNQGEKMPNTEQEPNIKKSPTKKGPTL